MRAMVLAAGRGVRFRPVTERIPKALFPYLNVPLVEAHLRRLRGGNVAEAGVNLHHLGGEIERHLSNRAGELPQLRFFPEPRILGTAGALSNAADFLDGEDFFVVNADAAIAPDFAVLADRHRASGRAATLLVVENREPQRYTPLQAEGDRITAFGRETARPLLYTGVCALSPRLLTRIPPGERGLVADLWEPLLQEKREEIGWLVHGGAFADLGRPGDFLRATLEALDRGGPFPEGSGRYEPLPRVLSLLEPGDFEARRCVLGGARIERGAALSESAVWEGSVVGSGASLSRCLLAGGRVAPGARHADALLWGAPGEPAVAWPLS